MNSDKSKHGAASQGSAGYLSPSDVSELTTISVNTLAHWRLEGRGPTYYRIGVAPRCRVLYARGDVDDWIGSHRRVTSESAPGEGGSGAGTRRRRRAGGK